MSVLSPGPVVPSAQQAPPSPLGELPLAGDGAPLDPAFAPALGPVHDLASALEQLTADGWHALHGLRWPGRWTVPLDHALVGPGGVVAVGTDAAPHLDGRRRAPRQGAALAVRAADVASLLFPEHRELVSAVLCTRVPAVPAVPGEAGVAVVGAGALVDHVRSLPVVLTAHEAEAVAHHLGWQLTTSARDRARAQAPAEPESPAEPEAPAELAAPVAAIPVPRVASPVEPAPSAAAPVFATRREAREAERRALAQAESPDA